jgi:hypothetical protein
MRHSHRPSALLLLVILFCFGAPVVAQDLDNVTIGGRVMDQNGAVIPGASVTAVLIKTKAGRTVITDEDGRFKIIQLAPGIYSIKASFTNFATEEKTDLTTVAAQNVQLDFHAETCRCVCRNGRSQRSGMRPRSIQLAPLSAARSRRAKLNRCLSHQDRRSI